MDDFDAFYDIFSKVVRDSEDPAKSLHPKIESIVTQLSKNASLKNFGQELILSSFKRDRKLTMRSKGSFIYLKPIKKGGVKLPIALIDVDFNSKSPTLRLEVAMFMIDDDKKLNSIGMRFETPESLEGGGRHDFHHAQLVKNVAKNFPLPNCPIWLPDQQPSFPLDAKDPVQLLICAIASVYGGTEIGILRRGCSEIWKRAQDMRLQPGLIKKLAVDV